MDIVRNNQATTNGVFSKQGLFIDATDTENNLYYDLTIPRPDITNEFSISLWVMLHNTGSTTLFNLTNDNHTTGNAKNIKLFTKYINQNHSFKAQLYNGDSHVTYEFDASGAETTGLNTFHNVIMTYSKSSGVVKFYANNKKVIECDDSNVLPDINELTVLEEIATENAITLHSYMIFNNSVLTEDDIQTIYNNGIPPAYYTH